MSLASSLSPANCFHSAITPSYPSTASRRALGPQRGLGEHVPQIETLRVPSDNASYVQSWFLLRGCKFLIRVHGHSNRGSGISSSDVIGAAMQFRVIWEIDIDADGPKEAVQQARAIQLTSGMSATVFDAWEYVTGKMHRIDLVEEPDRLDRDELFAVRAVLRLLQCDPETPPCIQELVTVILIFLDRDNMMAKRYDAGS
jgi:hypothetical protein